MTPQQLRIFSTVVRLGRVGLAARALGISQPSVSQQLRRFEEDMGFPLLESREGRMVPTRLGTEVNALAELVVAAQDKLQELARRAEGGIHGVLTVGANTTGGMYLAPSLIRSYARENPNIGVKLVIGRVTELIGFTAGGNCDVSVAGGPIIGENLDVVTIFEDRHAIIVSPTHPLAHQRMITPSTLEQWPFVVPDLGSRTRAVVEQGLRDAKIEAKIVLDYPDTETVKKAVEAGLGVGFLSREGVRRELEHGYLSEIAVEGLELRRPFQLFALKAESRSSLVDPFIASVQRQIALQRKQPVRWRSR